MSGCFWGPQHDSQWVPWPHLYRVGYGGTKLRHSVSRTHNQHLCTGYQRTHCKSNHLCNCLSTLLSKCLPLFLLFFGNFLARCCRVLPLHIHSMRKGGFSLLTACISSSCVFLVHLSVFLCSHGRQLHITLSKGEIASCAGPQLYLWTMKGQLLTCTDVSCGPQADILCVSFTQRQEWDPRNVIVTGCADGIIRVGFCVIAMSDSCCMCERDSDSANRSAAELYLYRILHSTQPWQSLHWYDPCS